MIAKAKKKALLETLAAKVYSYAFKVEDKNDGNGKKLIVTDNEDYIFAFNLILGPGGEPQNIGCLFYTTLGGGDLSQKRIQGAMDAAIYHLTGEKRTEKIDETEEGKKERRSSWSEKYWN